MVCFWHITCDNYLFFSAKLKNMSKGGSVGGKTSVKKTGNASGRDGSGSDVTATEAFTAY